MEPSIRSNNLEVGFGRGFAHAISQKGTLGSKAVDPSSGENIILDAVVTSVCAFGIFADVGGPKEAFIHVTALPDRRVDNIFRDQKLKVEVLSVDKENDRISCKVRIALLSV